MIYATLAGSEGVSPDGLRWPCHLRKLVIGIPGANSAGRARQDGDFMKRLMLSRSSLEIGTVLIFGLSMAIPVAGIAQTSITGIAPTAMTEVAANPVTEVAPAPVTQSDQNRKR